MSKGNKLKNIVIVNDFAEIKGGADNVAINTANYLANFEDYNIYFFTSKKENNECLSENINLICTDQIESIKEKNKFIGVINNIYNIKAKNAFISLLSKLNKEETIIHFHGWTKVLSSSVFKASFDMGFKTVLTAHECFSCCANGVFYNFKKKKICEVKGMSIKCLLSNCDNRNYLYKILRYIRLLIQNKYVRLTEKINNVIVVSDLNKNIIKDYFNKETKFYNVFNPISNCETYKSNKKNYYLFIGRLEESKGIIDFCNAIVELNLNALVIGDGELYSYCKGKYTNIEFLGWLNQNEINKYLSEAKALIYPSLAYESFGLSILEAISMGVPVICSETCGAKNLIKNNYNGFIYNNYNDLTNKLKRIEKSNLKIKKDDIKQIREKYSYKRYIDKLISVYDSLINE